MPALETVLGLKRRGAAFSLDPCVPFAWPGFSIVLRFGHTRYEITVQNPRQRCRGIATVDLDGEPVDAASIPLRDDGRTHTVLAVIGDPVMAGSGV